MAEGHLDFGLMMVKDVPSIAGTAMVVVFILFRLEPVDTEQKAMTQSPRLTTTDSKQRRP